MMLLRLVSVYARPYRPQIVGVLGFQLLATIASLYLPSLNAQIIDQGVLKGDIGYIWAHGGLMLVVAMAQLLAAVCGVYFGAWSSMALGRDLRRAVFRKVSRFSVGDLNRFGSATLITRGTNDVQQVQMMVLMALNFMVSAPIMCVGGVIMALREDASLSWLVWVSVLVLLVLVGFVVSRLIPLFKSMQGKIDSINDVLREQIVGIRVIRAFVREPYESSRFGRANVDLNRVSLRIGSVFVLMFPLIMMVLHLATAAVFWFGGQRVDAGEMQVGALTAFLQYLLQILMAVMMGTFMVMMLPRAVICAERIAEVLDVEPSLSQPESPADLGSARGEIEFRSVTFQYPGAEAPVLKDLSFIARPGETVAIIGSTGTGKSTLLSLVPRLHDPAEGQILLDGVPVDTLSSEDLAARVTLIPQKPYLFAGTIASNLRFGRLDATDEELWEALHVAQADDFVKEKPEGLDSAISQGGTNVSGGQRQRLCIARALVMAPKVYLFDDSFSALDVATDAKLRRALEETTHEVTKIIVAQRVATVVNADQILVLEGGQIVARGTHEELAESSRTYQEIMNSQLNVEEVA